MPARPSTQEVVFGGLMAALTIALAAPLGPLVPSALALPVALAYARHGRRSAVWSALVAAAGCLMFYDLVTVVGFIIPSGILAGLALGWGARNQRPAVETVAMATTANVAGYAASWFLALLVQHQDPMVQFQEGITSALAWLSSLGPQAEPVIRLVEPYLRRSVIASAIGYSCIMAIAAYLIALLIFRRLGHPLPPPPPLARLRLTLWWALLFVLAVAITRISLPGRLFDLTQGLCYNLTLLLYPLFTMQGVIVAAVLARGAGLGRGGAFLAGALVFFIGGAALFLGLADSLLDLRSQALPPPAGR